MFFLIFIGVVMVKYVRKTSLTKKPSDGLMETVSMEDTLDAFRGLEAHLKRENKGLLDKFDLAEYFGSKEIASKHLRNLQQACSVVEGNIGFLEELRDGGGSIRYPLNPDLFSSSVFCCRRNIIEPALGSVVFRCDLEHVKDALNVLYGWANVEKQR